MNKHGTTVFRTIRVLCQGQRYVKLGHAYAVEFVSDALDATDFTRHPQSVEDRVRRDFRCTPQSINLTIQH